MMVGKETAQTIDFTSSGTFTKVCSLFSILSFHKLRQWEAHMVFENVPKDKGVTPLQIHTKIA